MEMYRFAREKSDRIIVIGCSRQLGKTYFLATLAIEECLRKPNIIVKMIAPTRMEVKRNISPKIREITEDCPEDIKPVYSSQDYVFRFKNGSQIQLAGTDNGHAESIRGTAAHLCLIDEAGFCSNLDYVVKSILLPTTTTTDGKIVMASTPSKAPDHDFIQFMKAAELEDRFIKKTIYDNPRLKQEQIDELAAASGGYESIDFKREYLVEIITSEDDAVVPEFNADLKSKIVTELERPPYFDTYVSMDIGVTDLTGVLFGYYDFRLAKLVIEDEIVLQGRKMLTDNLAAMIKEKEAKLWFNKYTGEPRPVFLRIADNNNGILINDLGTKHDLNFVKTDKDNKEAQLNNMRMLLRSERVIINPRCRNLIYHLESGIWAKDRKTYARSADKGHYDLIDALCYLCRNVNFNKNPYPANYDFQGKGPMFFTDEFKASQTTSFEKSMEKMVKERNPFKINSKRKRY